MFAVWSLCVCYVLAMWLLSGCYVVLNIIYVIAIWLLCGFYVFVMWLLRWIHWDSMDLDS